MSLENAFIIERYDSSRPLEETVSRMIEQVYKEYDAPLKSSMYGQIVIQVALQLACDFDEEKIISFTKLAIKGISSIDKKVKSS